jgi:hypothetical protein
MIPLLLPLAKLLGIKGATPKADKPNPYAGLRSLALAVRQGKLGLNLPVIPAIVFGVVVDCGMEAGVVTITSFVSGEASVYISSGGGFLGGVGRPQINAAAKRSVAAAQEVVEQATDGDDDTLPETGAAGVVRRWRISLRRRIRGSHFSVQ